MAKSRARLWSDDSGVALITVLGVIAVITVLAAGSYYLASESLHESLRVEDESRAFRAANSGMDLVLTTFNEESIESAYPITGSTPDGAYTITLEELGAGEYRLKSVGLGSDGSTETVLQQFYFMNLWKMNFAGTGDQSLISGSGGLAGTTNIIGPFYMKGNLAIANNMSVLEGPLFVRGGDVTIGASGTLGSESELIKVFCDGDVPPNAAKGNAGGVFVSSVSHSVPDIRLPEIGMEDMEQWATKAQAESVDNIRGAASVAPQTANLETDVFPGSGARYQVMQPPNAVGWTREYADTRAARNLNYKYIGAQDGTITPTKGAGPYGLSIGGRSFGSWGSVVTTDGVNLPGDGHYTLANTWDDFAYDNENNRLYISGTVFIDGPLHFTEDMTYVGNGSIVCNGDIQIDGYLRPYGTNAQGENNKWALGLVTPGDIVVSAQASNAYNAETARDEVPTLAGAFYAEGVVDFEHNVLMRGSVIAGNIESDHPNMCLITNPLLPTYLPESLPGVDIGLLMPGLWTRQ
ncbi:MAG: hypothetical protein WBI63_09050 [Coriobacteriia bacterium]